jgi:peptidoglycan hydrolase-like protein with peptidoglycan-binding domain
LAGFSGPAVDSANAPVVRYQDLMRTSAPASAGTPAFGRIANDAPNGFGAEPLPMPTEQMLLGSYGAFGYAGSPTSTPTYEYLKENAPVLGRGDKGEWVTELQRLLIERGYAVGFSEPTGNFAEKTENSVKTKLAQAMRAVAANATVAEGGDVDLAAWAFLYRVMPAQKTERETAEQAEKTEAEAQNTGRKPSAVEQFLTGAAKQAGFIPSGKDDKPKQEINKDGDQTGTDWGKIALIGGGVLVGITSLVLITRALTSKE